MTKVTRKSPGVYTVGTRVKVDGATKPVTFFLMNIKDMPKGRTWVLSLRDGARLVWASYYGQRRDALDRLPKAFVSKPDGSFALDTAH